MEDRINRPLFGPGGNGDLFRLQKKKSTLEAPAWVRSMGLDAYEFEAGQGLHTGEDMLLAIGKAARDVGIHMSYHAPYFISLSGVVPEKRLKSLDYIAESLCAAALLGAGVIVVHTGSAAKITREEAMRLCADTLDRVLTEIPLNGISIGLETMGKINQLGTLEEVITLCKMDPRLVPVVDFGHMNAREQGGIFPNADAYRSVFDRIGNALGDRVARNLHCHYSRIEWTASGEKRHLTFSDSGYGPEFEPLMEAIEQEGLTPTIICESAGTQAEDALAMKQYYISLLKQRRTT